MNKLLFLSYFFIFSSLTNSAQESVPELQKYAKASLFDLEDHNCVDLSGEWIGEEIQYDPTASFIKVKFKVVFKLVQEGNKITGTSYIEDKFRGSYGDMKIRGLISGNKLHFEEFEIVDEKFFQKGVVWCLRSGEMNLKYVGNKLTLEGLNYNGYSSDTYSECTDYAKMSLQKNSSTYGYSPKNGDKSNLEGSDKVYFLNKTEMLVYPNPCLDKTNVTFQLKQKNIVHLDIFSLSGSHLETIVAEERTEGNQLIELNLSSYLPGVYLIRLYSGNEFSTKQLVKSK